MKITTELLLPFVVLTAFSSCSTTTVVKPEPTTVSESVRRTSSTSTSSYGVPHSATSTETRSVTTQ